MQRDYFFLKDNRKNKYSPNFSIQKATIVKTR